MQNRLTDLLTAIFRAVFVSNSASEYEQFSTGRLCHWALYWFVEYFGNDKTITNW